MAPPVFPHLDDLAGRLAGLAQQLAPRTHDTREALRAYEDLDLEAIFPEPSRVPGDVRVRRRWSLPGLTSEDVSFRSLHEPLDPAFRRRYADDYSEIHTVWARRVRPSGSGARPRLLYLHGYMQPETVVEELVLLATLARRFHVEVVQMQPPYHGRRKPRRAWLHGDRYWTGDVVRSVEALRQTLLDARTLLAWMLAESDRPVGVSGLSLGGLLTCGLTCLEERFCFSMPLIAHMDIGAVVADAPVLVRMRRELRDFGWQPSDFGAFFDRIGWNALPAKLPPERIRIFAARDDRFFDPRLVQAMADRWGGPAIEWYDSSHMGFAANLPRCARPMRAFIDGCAAGLPSAREPVRVP
jgi:pimeloyl-ACP methyl ester carboxylesterase